MSDICYKRLHSFWLLPPHSAEARKWQCPNLVLLFALDFLLVLSDKEKTKLHNILLVAYKARVRTYPSESVEKKGFLHFV